jgi:imidazolonepropionase-like amidohydrolase
MSIRVAIFAISAASLMSCAVGAAEPPVAFIGVNVVPMDRDRVLTNHTVIVADGKILAVGPANTTTVPTDSRRIDAQGKYLMPGLAEMHGHIPAPNSPPQFVEDVLYLYVANGVTTVRGMLGYEGQLALRERTKRNEIVSPTLYLAGPSFNANTPKTPEEAVGMVRTQKTAGWDLLKVHPGPTVPIYDAMARTAKEVGIRFGGHVPPAVGLLHVIESGQETIDHVDGYVEYLQDSAGRIDAAKLKDVVRKTKDAGVWIVPTMALWETLQGAVDLQAVTSYPELKYMPPDMVESWTATHRKRLESVNLDTAKRTIRNRMQILATLHQAGVPILLGTDAPQQFSVPGFSIHREVTRMIDAGMKPYDVLRAGTYNVGLYFKGQDTFGTVEPGRRADLILLEGNPLDNVANLARRTGVMIRGIWIPEADIQSRLAKIAASYRQPS